MSDPIPVDEPADWEWLDVAVVAGHVDVAGHECRSRVFAQVNADRDGPVARRLLVLAADHRPSVRLTVLRLLCDLCQPAGTWDSVAEVASVRLGDSDDDVRRAAAWLLAASGGVVRTLSAFDKSSEPATRAALAEAVLCTPSQREPGDGWTATVARMRHDDLPAVRFLASIQTLQSAESSDWPALDAALRRDLEAATGVLGAAGGRISWSPGRRWAFALARLDREEDSISLAAQLLAPDEPLAVRQAGVDLAVEAMRTWRAAAARLAPQLVAVLAEPASPVRAAAAQALCASLTSTRLTAAHLAELLTDPDLSTSAAVALAEIGDHRAVPHLMRMLAAGDVHPRLTQALVVIAPTLNDLAALVTVARAVLDRHSDPCDQRRTSQRCPAGPAIGCLAALGPKAAAAVPELIARLQAASLDGIPAQAASELHALGQIGPAARSAVPLLRQLAATESVADLAVVAVLKITSERSVADGFLDARPEQLRRCRIGPALLTWLSEHGGLTDRQDRQLRHLFTQPGAMQVRAAAALWRHAGPAAAPDLLRELPKYLDDDIFGHDAMKVLAAMDWHALPALADLDRLIQAHRRVTVYIGDQDAEMRADERLQTLAISTREQICATPPR